MPDLPDESTGPSDEPTDDLPRPSPSARRKLAAVLAALFLATLIYKVLHVGQLEQTALFYVGLPAVLAITVALVATPRSMTGLIMWTITVAILLSGPLLNEGIVCLIFAAPLFYGLGALLGLSIDHVWARRRPGAQALLAIPLLLMAMEGTVYNLGRAAEASATRFVPAPPRQVEAALAAVPEFHRPESLFLRLRFPRPVRASGTGLDPGDQRVIEFTPRQPLGIGASPAPRSMTLQVSDRSPGRVVFRVVADSTLAKWLDLYEAEVAWHAVEGGTELRWTLRYRRTFDPAWYFGPIQHYGMTEAADYLADTFARAG